MYGLILPKAPSQRRLGDAGLMFFRHSTRTAALINAWNDKLEADSKLWDQEAFNVLVRDGFFPFKTHPNNDRLFAGFKQTVWVGVLPVAAFASGHTFFVQNLHEVTNERHQPRPHLGLALLATARALVPIKALWRPCAAP